MYRITEIVKHLLIINVLAYIGLMFMGEPASGEFYDLINERSTDFSSWGRYRLAMFFPTSDYFRPYQLITHMFMHARDGGSSFFSMHLFSNMFALFMFGPPLESRWGAKRFLQFYFITGLGAMLLYSFVKYLEINYFGASPFTENVPMLGASGAVFGLLAGYGMTYPENRIMLLIPPIPMKAKYFVIIYALIELFLGLSPFQTGVAHFAHLGGAIFGVLLILYWKNTRQV